MFPWKQVTRFDMRFDKTVYGDGIFYSGRGEHLDARKETENALINVRLPLELYGYTESVHCQEDKLLLYSAQGILLTSSTSFDQPDTYQHLSPFPLSTEGEEDRFDFCLEWINRQSLIFHFAFSCQIFDFETQAPLWSWPDKPGDGEELVAVTGDDKELQLAFYRGSDILVKRMDPRTQQYFAEFTLPRMAISAMQLQHSRLHIVGHSDVDDEKEEEESEGLYVFSLHGEQLGFCRDTGNCVSSAGDLLLTSGVTEAALWRWCNSKN